MTSVTSHRFPNDFSDVVFPFIFLSFKFHIFHSFQSAIKSNGYRTLAEGEQVSFKITDSDKGQIAVGVTSADGGTIKGASRKNRAKQGARKYTSLCFNCNKEGHRAKKCPYERKTNRTCHKCGSNMHIIRKCPLVLVSAKENSENGQEKTEECELKERRVEGSTERIQNGKVIDINHNYTSVSC
jgi:hypothetical protein